VGKIIRPDRNSTRSGIVNSRGEKFKPIGRDSGRLYYFMGKCLKNPIKKGMVSIRVFYSTPPTEVNRL